MCGLVGIISYNAGITRPDLEGFMGMLLLNSMRGPHSTGIFGIDKQRRIDYIKKVGGPSRLFEEGIFKTWLERSFMKHEAIFGHGRYATQGAITADNAHPFTVGDVTLIHNGTLTNFQELKKRHNLPKIEVDSHLCAHLLDKLSPEEVKKEIFGAYAFIWYNSAKNSVFVMRNHERPLYLFDRTGRDQYLFSSDASVFAFLEDKYKMSGKVLSFNTDSFYEFSLEKKEVKQTPFYKPVETTTPKTFTGYPTGSTNTSDSSISNITRSEVSHLPGMDSIKKDAWIDFWPMECKTLKTKTTEDHHIVTGSLVDNPEVLVRCMFKGDWSQYSGELLLSGKVDKIFRVYSHDTARVMFTILCNQMDFGDLDGETPIEFMNRVTLPLKSATDLLAKGCSCCKKKLKLSTADFITVIDNKAYCLNCNPATNVQQSAANSCSIH